MRDAQTLSDRLEIDDLLTTYTMAIDVAMVREDGMTWHLDIAGVYVHSLVRTPEGWRSRRLVEELLWDRRSE